MPPVRLCWAPGAGGPQPQLGAHQAGDPGAAAGAAWLCPLLSPGEENDHRGLYLRHPRGPASVLGATLRAGNIGEKKCFPLKKSPSGEIPQPGIAGIRQILLPNLSKLSPESHDILAVIYLFIDFRMRSVVMEGRARVLFVAPSSERGKQCFLKIYFFIVVYIGLVNQINCSFQSCPWQ